MRETHHGQTSNYTNDSTGQLTAADHSAQTDENYQYDANGNRIGGGYVVGPNNQVLSVVEVVVIGQDGIEGVASLRCLLLPIAGFFSSFPRDPL